MLGLLLLASCNKNKQTVSMESVNSPKSWQDEENDLKECDLNKIAAHDERDTIVGNFTGKSIDTLYLKEKEYLGKVFPAIDDRQYYMVSNNRRIPRIKLFGSSPKLVNEGDLDGNGTCEVGYLHTCINGQYRQYYILTLRNGQWRNLVDGELLFTQAWFRCSGIEVALPGPLKGTVLIHYGEIRDNSDGTYIQIIKDTIVKPSYSRITD